MTEAASRSAPAGAFYIDAEKALAALAHGRRLCAEQNRADPSPADIIYALMAEAVDTLWRMPDRERGWLYGSQRSSWPAIAQRVAEDAAETFATGVQRAAIGEEAVERPAPPRAPADPAAIDRLDVVLPWLRFVKTRRPLRDVKILMARAGGLPVYRIARLAGLSPRQRRSVYDRSDTAVLHIVRGLRRAGLIG